MRDRLPTPDDDHSDFFVIGFLIIMALIALGGGGVAISIRDTPPPHDDTALCNRPSSQLGC